MKWNKQNIYQNYVIFFKVPGIKRSIEVITKYVMQQLEEHEATFDPENIRDMLDLHIQLKQAKDVDQTEGEVTLTYALLSYIIQLMTFFHMFLIELLPIVYQ